MSLDTGLRQQIAACVDQGFAEQIAFTQEMVRFQSTRGNEHKRPSQPSDKPTTGRQANERG